jgi:hypothetical protein
MEKQSIFKPSLMIFLGKHFFHIMKIKFGMFKFFKNFKTLKTKSNWKEYQGD